MNKQSSCCSDIDCIVRVFWNPRQVAIQVLRRCAANVMLTRRRTISFDIDRKCDEIRERWKLKQSLTLNLIILGLAVSCLF